MPTLTQTGGAGLNLARALFMGMEAGAWAECKDATWDEDNTSSDADFGDKPAICYGFTGGFCKLVFHSIDWGIAVVDTYAPEPAGSSH